MKTGLKKILRVLPLSMLCLSMLLLNTGCKLFNPWQGDEQVNVMLGDKTVAVSLKGMFTKTYDGVVCLNLANVVKRANLATTANLAQYTFNFISSSGLNMSSGLAADMSLPTWSDMQKGYFYADSDTSKGLSVQWETGTTPGDDTGNYYTATLMAGGTIQLVASGAPANPWQGAEEVEVTFGTATATVHLSDLNISTYESLEGVRLSDVVEKANLADVADLEKYYFNFIASDGYDMSVKAQSSQKSLPVWSDMEKGYLYDSGTSSGLCVKWEAGTAPGDFGKFFNAKYMNGGTIEIREDNVL